MPGAERNQKNGRKSGAPTPHRKPEINDRRLEAEAGIDDRRLEAEAGIDTGRFEAEAGIDTGRFEAEAGIDSPAPDLDGAVMAGPFYRAP
jgi:hypothetical protein